MERNCKFVTVVSNDQKPDVEVHIAGFDEKDGIATCISIEGHGHSMAKAVAGLVGHLVDTFKEHDKRGAAKFVSMIGDEIMEHGGKEIVELAEQLDKKDAVTSALEELLEDLKEALGIKEDED